MKAIILDTETASLKGGVCDLAMVEVDAQFNVLNQWESLIDPERPIEPGAQAIHGISYEMVENEPTLDEFMELHGHPLQDDGLLVIAYNVDFDRKMLASVLPERHKKFCALKLARAAYPELKNHKLQTVREAFGLEGGTAHRAMGDVQTTLSFLRHVAQEQKTDLHGLILFNNVPLTPDTRFPWGAHAGKKLKDIPKSYVRWLLANATLEDDMRAALTALA